MFKLSIITINLNNLNGLRLTYDSVISQEYVLIDYVIIDGLSSDGSLDFLSTTKHPEFVRWISEKDSGIYEAMNKGIKLARGEYVLFLNSGDYLLNEHSIFEISKHLDSKYILYSDIFLDYSNQLIEHKSIANITRKKYFNSYLHHQSIIYPKNILGFYDEKYKYVADWLKNYQLLLTGKKFLKYNKIFSVYNTTGLTSSGISMHEALSEKLNIKLELFSFDYLRYNLKKFTVIKIFIKYYFNKLIKCFVFEKKY